MSSKFGFRRAAIGVAISAAAVYVYRDYVIRPVTVWGLTRTVGNTPLAEGDFVVIADTKHCEDMHYHEISQTLFAACEGAKTPRYSWFPPCNVMDDAETAMKSQGTIQVIDPKTMKAKALILKDFSGPFLTHGIDVYNDPDKPIGDAVYILAVNHKPNPLYFGPNGNKNTYKSHSVIEVFHHYIGTDSAEHIRTVWHPLIETPNDIVALSPTVFLVTNDHFYREGLMKTVEDGYFGAKWSTVIRVEFEFTKGAAESEGVQAVIALNELHNNNGIGRGRSDTEVAIATASSGTLNLADLERPGDAPATVHLKETIQFDSTLDNPHYFFDPYYNRTHDYSGFILAGSSNGPEIFQKARVPGWKHGVMIWKLTQNKKSAENWDKTLIFTDDGSRISSATASSMVAIPPKQEHGQRKGWLFLTGPYAENIIAAKLDL